MLKIKIPAQELWDEDKEEFIYISATVLKLEHSLKSISRWESKWLKPFLSKEEKTFDESIDYIKCMTINSVDENVYSGLSNSQLNRIFEYIGSPMTATTFRDQKRSLSRQIITSELIYYWMVAYQIPFSCENWHLNRLLTLIEICNRENQPDKKMSKSELMARNRKLNAARRMKNHTRG